MSHTHLFGVLSLLCHTSHFFGILPLCHAALDAASMLKILKQVQDDKTGVRPYSPLSFRTCFGIFFASILPSLRCSSPPLSRTHLFGVPPLLCHAALDAASILEILKRVQDDKTSVQPYSLLSSIPNLFRNLFCLYSPISSASFPLCHAPISSAFFPYYITPPTYSAFLHSYVTPHLMRHLEVLKQVQDKKWCLSLLYLTISNLFRNLFLPPFSHLFGILPLLHHATYLFGIPPLLCHAALDAASILEILKQVQDDKTSVQPYSPLSSEFISKSFFEILKQVQD